jgi:uncharacterized membrane protein YtjA (UPF0391 family)
VFASPDVGSATPPIARVRGWHDTRSIDPDPSQNDFTRGAFSATHQEPAMLHYAVVFFVIALIAALFGFGGIAASAVGIAKILFVVFAVLAIASFLFGLIRKG